MGNNQGEHRSVGKPLVFGGARKRAVVACCSVVVFASSCGELESDRAEVHPAADFGFAVDGTPIRQVADDIGRTWEYVGRLSDHPLSEALTAPPAYDPEGSVVGGTGGPADDETMDTGDFGADVDEEVISFVLVPEGPQERWLVYELVDDDPVALAQAIAAYDLLHPDPPSWGEVSVADTGGFTTKDIIGTDDRVDLSTDIFTVGGSTDNLTAMRRLTTDVSSCTASMLSLREGITAAHCFTDNNGETDVTSADVCFGNATGCIAVDEIFVNAAYRSNQLKKNDWALFRTSSSVSMGSGAFFTLDDTTNEANGQVINNVGAPGGDPKAHFGCEIKDVFARRLAYNCDTVLGHSGGPTYKFFSASNTRQLVAVHAGAMSFWNTGARVSFWRDDIISGLNALPGGAGTEPL